MRTFTVLLVAMAVLGCGARSRPPSSSQTPSSSPEPAATAPGQGKAVSAWVRVVGMDGVPIAGMIPIATEQPNAFTKPVAQGNPTDDTGRSCIALDTDRWLYVRAWDPSMRLFANIYYDIPPGDAPIAKDMEVVMVEAASLRAQLFDPAGRPAANENVGLMMFHPEKGPWWPGEGDTSGEGIVVFPHVPPGKYLLKIKALKSGMIELPEVPIPPGRETDLGRIQLLESAENAASS